MTERQAAASKKVFREPILLLIACSVVGAMAALGYFNSMFNFPWIFGLVCLLFGLLSLRKERSVALVPRALLILLAAAIAFAGWRVQVYSLEQRLEETQREVFAELGGKAAPPLTGLKSLNTEAEVLERAASLTSKATILTFWARWCGPCWKELPELDEFYRQHETEGLAVVAITAYDEPTDAEERQKEFVKAQDYVRKRALTFPAAIATDNAIHRSYQVRSLPSAALIDGQGTLVAYGVGVEGGRDLMRQALSLLEAERAVASPGAG